MHFRYSPKSRRKFDALAFAALCHERTNALQQTTPVSLLDHLVGSSLKLPRHRKLQRSGGFEIDHQFETCGLLDR